MKPWSPQVTPKVQCLPATAGVATEKQLSALTAHSAIRLIAIIVIHVEQLKEAILAARKKL